MTLKEIDNIDFEKGNGLVPVIVQDSESKDVLTLAYTNKESLELTKKTGNSWFWSRSRNKLWMKGEESGNTQKVKKILVCLLYTSPSPRDISGSRMPSSA